MDVPYLGKQGICSGVSIIFSALSLSTVVVCGAEVAQQVRSMPIRNQAFQPWKSRQRTESHRWADRCAVFLSIMEGRELSELPTTNASS